MSDPRGNGTPSEGMAALQMSMAYISSLASIYDTLDRKATLLASLSLTALALLVALSVAFDRIHWVLALPALIAVIEAAGCGFVAYPRTIRMFIDPVTLEENYRYGGWSDHDVAWVLVKSIKESAVDMERLTLRKANIVSMLQIGFGLLVVSAIVCFAIAWLWGSQGGWAEYPSPFPGC